MKSIALFVVGVVATVAAVGIATGFGGRSSAESTALAISEGVIVFEVRSVEPVVVWLRVDHRVGSFTHDGGTSRYLVAAPMDTEDDVITVEAEGDGDVEIDLAPRSEATGVYPQWRPEGDMTVAPSVAATPTSPARASVDETDTFGVRIFGVPARTEPQISAPVVTVVHHGERFVAECWAVGDTVTDGFDEQADDDITYTSNVWFFVDVPNAGMAYIPDTRFSRTGHGDRLDLPEC